MTSIRSAFLAAAEAAGQLRPVCAGELQLLYPGTIGQLFSKSTTPKRVDPKLSDPLCIHVAHTYDETGEFVLETKKCKYPAEVGFLCRLHDARLLNRKALGKPRDFDAERVGSVIVTEAIALRDLKREVIGLKTKIQFAHGVRMQNDPEPIVREVIKVEGLKLDVPIFPEPDMHSKRK